LKQIYSVNGVPNFIRIRHFGLFFFLDTLYVPASSYTVFNMNNSNSVEHFSHLINQVFNSRTSHHSLHTF